MRNRWQLLGCPRIRQNRKKEERWLFLSQVRKEPGSGHVGGHGGGHEAAESRAVVETVVPVLPRWCRCQQCPPCVPACPSSTRAVLSLHRCDADPSALANYVVALVKKDKPEKELKAFCADQLDVFLQKGTLLCTALSVLGGHFVGGRREDDAPLVPSKYFLLSVN